MTVRTQSEIVLTCDRCGFSIDVVKIMPKGWAKLCRYQPNFEDPAKLGNHVPGNNDLCPPCNDQFEDFLRNHD